MRQLEIITTADGSHSLRDAELNETYHSVHGARQESIHVFINNGLNYVIKANNTDKINILEVGFGTGLNALLTLEFAVKHRLDVHYTSLETSPLPYNVWSILNFPDTDQSKERFHQLHNAPWDKEMQLQTGFHLLKLMRSLQDVILKGPYDLVYYDAFAPSKQPEMWALPILQKVADAMGKSGIFVTYCAKGQLKRDLKAVGFVVTTLPGPPGKKEMVQALKIF